jgi:FlaG/FlaF family flagellin (archaellin)
MSGIYGIGGVLFVAVGLMLAGTIVEMTTFGDKPEVSAPELEQALYEAGKFRRLKQYESVLL